MSTNPYNPGSEFTQTSGYPYRNDGTTKHDGIDFDAWPGTDIPAMAGGTVIFSGWSGTYGGPGIGIGNGFGYLVVLLHTGANGQQFTTWYGHQSGMNMPARLTQIPSGGKVGEVGNTGRSSAPHVHIEVRNGSNTTGPKEVLDPNRFDNWPAGGPYDAASNGGGVAKQYPKYRIEKQKEKFKEAVITKLPDPLVFDLNGDGVRTTSVDAGAFFDHDGNGFAEQTGWISPDDGLLVWDRNGDGIINDGKELFGDSTLLKNGLKAANGYQALAEWDDNADGLIDSRDAVWANLKIWRDSDSDGYSLPSELLSLADLGVQSVSTSYSLPGSIDGQGNIQTHLGSFTRSDGSTGQIADYLFKVDRAYNIADAWLDIPAEIAALPDANGYGNVYGLRQAMVRDTTGSLKDLVVSLVAETDVAQRNSIMDTYRGK